MSRSSLIEHLRANSLRTDGPFVLRSGAESSWYLDARTTTFNGEGAWLTGEAVLEALGPEVVAAGGMTLGADPIAVAVAMVAHSRGRAVSAFSIRKTGKGHGIGDRVVNPPPSGAKVAILEDTTTTGSAAGEATDVLLENGYEVVQAVALVDRSQGVAEAAFVARGIPYTAIVVPSDLGVI